MTDTPEMTTREAAKKLGIPHETGNGELVFHMSGEDPIKVFSSANSAIGSVVTYSKVLMPNHSLPIHGKTPAMVDIIAKPAHGLTPQQVIEKIIGLQSGKSVA